MEHILFWLNENSGFLNFLTVFASLITCLFSFLSAKAAWAQVKEMRKQYEEENRPYIEVEFLYMRRTYYGLRFINHGRCSAQNVKILLDSSFIDSLPEETFAGLLRKQVGKSCVIGVGQYYDLYFGTQQYRNLPDKPPARGTISYQANGKNYKSEFYIDMESYATIFSVQNEEEDFLAKIKEQNKALVGIENAIQGLKLHTNEEKENV